MQACCKCANLKSSLIAAGLPNKLIGEEYKRRRAVQVLIATSAQLKNGPLKPITPQFFSLDFDTNQKKKIPPPVNGIQMILHPQPHFTVLSSRASTRCEPPKKTVFLNVVAEHGQPDTSQPAAPNTNHVYHKKGAAKEENKSIFMCTSGPKRQGGNAPFWMFDFELPQRPRSNT